MRYQKLIEEHSEWSLSGLPDLEITALTADSRQVVPGALFVAVPGEAHDGHEFIPDAAANGAVVAFGQSSEIRSPIPYVHVDDSRLALAQLAAAWFGFPARKLTMLGVTGTDGKSTTCNYLFEIFQVAGIKAGMITTVNAIIGDRTSDTGLHVTTPGALEVQGYLSEMVTAGMTHCILESTSHGLAQHRVSACDFDIAVITNITHEHLDYHGSLEAYQQAKASLFSGLADSWEKHGSPPKTAILNRDDDSFELLDRVTQVRKITYGSQASATVMADGVTSSSIGVRFTAVGPEYRQPIHTHLLGVYNVSNCLAAFAAAVEGSGLSPVDAAAGIERLRAVPGRMEVLDLGQPFTAIVDFAHTPNALRRALQAARELTEGRVITVFGSAGLRDREKRRLMAEVSMDWADITILTAEDPRTESLDQILSEMAQGAELQGGKEGVNFWRVPDRGEAIRMAVGTAEPGDLVIACGKGHEQSMCFEEIEYPWDDRIAMQAALAELLGVSGPEMPRLPTSSH